MYFSISFILISFQLIQLVTKPCDSLKPKNLVASRPQSQLLSFGRISAFIPLPKPKAKALYIQSLKDQIFQMERQLRLSEMESVQLRSLIKVQSSKKRKSSSEFIREQANIEERMNEVINELKNQIQELKKSKVELEELLKTEQDSTTKIEQILKEEMVKSEKLIQDSKKQMEEMKDSIMKKAKLQMEEMEKSQATKFKKDLEKVRLDSEEALKEEREKLKAALKKEREALENEKRKGEAAVEKERVKMRKLVKVLAAREKRDLAWASKKQGTNKKNSKGKEKPHMGGTSAKRNVARKARVRGKTNNS